MTVIERGTGDPIVLIPGLQGRWEYIRAAVDALSQSHRVITFPLCDEPAAQATCDRARGFDSYADQVTGILDERGITRAVICGISFGGIIALRFAARFPAQTAALIMVSAPGPHWHLKRRHEMYTRYPWLFGPLFACESPFRLRREISVALPDRRDRATFVLEQLRTLGAAPLSFRRMAARARLIGSHDRAADCSRLDCPTLIVHGDPSLDHVVKAGGTAEYAGLIRRASLSTLERTGHLGSITRPGEFANTIDRFLSSLDKDTRHSAA